MDFSSILQIRKLRPREAMRPVLGKVLFTFLLVFFYQQIMVKIYITSNLPF